MASNSEVADCNQLNNSPFPSTCVEEAMVDAKLMKRSYSLKSVFSLSILGYCRNMAGSIAEDPLPM